VNTPKIIIFKKGGKLKATERSKMKRLNIEYVELMYRGIMLERTGKWKKGKH
jgi:hypothetical protein